MPYTIECVPNFSEGRDAGKVQSILAALLNGPGVACLDITMDPDHHRSVATLAGNPEGIARSALRGIEAARDLIDLNHHAGVHPRIGAADVVPFAPLDGGASLSICVDIARRVAKEAWERLGIPAYLYGAAARVPERRELEAVRRGQFEGLREQARLDPARKPDFGSALHPTAGASAIGARNFLVAYNINLDVADAALAQQIARKVRASGGGLAGVKALGLLLPSRNVAQVSLNITDFRTASLAQTFEAVEREAADLGAGIADSELIGLIPRAALEGAPLERMRIRDFSPARILENRLAHFGPLRSEVK